MASNELRGVLGDARYLIERRHGVLRNLPSSRVRPWRDGLCGCLTERCSQERFGSLGEERRSNPDDRKPSHCLPMRESVTAIVSPTLLVTRCSCNGCATLTSLFVPQSIRSEAIRIVNDDYTYDCLNQTSRAILIFR